jgi:pimeloyl-ACP methyl ester carboxylesterase
MTTSATDSKESNNPTNWWTGRDGNRLAGDAWGEPGAPLVVLQHGGGQTRHAWKGTGRVLGDMGYHAIALDARGHGDSQWVVDGDYSADAMIADLRCVLASIATPRPALVGASMGGGTSLAAVGEGVEASALVLVDMAPRLEPTGVARIRAFMAQKPEGFGSLEEVADAIASYQPHRARPTNLEGLRKNVRPMPDGRFRWHWDPKFMDRNINAEIRHERLADAARNLRLPTLLVRGGLSDVLSEQGAQEFRALCPECEYVNITGAAHMIAGDRNDVFAQSLVEFLSRKVPVPQKAG